jgi:hypothetical protein
MRQPERDEPLEHFEQFLAQTSRELLGTPAERFASVAEAALAGVGELFDTDRAALQRLEADSVAIRYTWGKPDLLERLELAFELFEDGLAMLRERLRRERPAAPEEEIEAAVLEFLFERRQAPLGDADGRPRQLDLR